MPCVASSHDQETLIGPTFALLNIKMFLSVKSLPLTSSRRTSEVSNPLTNDYYFQTFFLEMRGISIWLHARTPSWPYCLMHMFPAEDGMLPRFMSSTSTFFYLTRLRIAVIYPGCTISPPLFILHFRSISFVESSTTVYSIIKPFFCVLQLFSSRLFALQLITVLLKL